MILRVGMQLVLACIVLASCRPIHVASDYDQQCVRDGECVAVFVGDTCRRSCEAGGIRIDEKARYDEAHALACPPNVGEIFGAVCLGNVPEPVACDTIDAFCDDGTCAARSVPIEEQ